MQSVMRDTRGNTYVYVVDKDNKVERRNIVATQTQGTFWIVDSGIQAGDRVIFEGFQRTAPGCSCDPKRIRSQIGSRRQAALLTPETLIHVFAFFY